MAGHLDAAEKLQISVRVQSVLAYAMFLPLFLYILFAGKYLKSMGYDGAAKGADLCFLGAYPVRRASDGSFICGRLRLNRTKAFAKRQKPFCCAVTKRTQ